MYAGHGARAPHVSGHVCMYAMITKCGNILGYGNIQGQQAACMVDESQQCNAVSRPFWGLLTMGLKLPA